jgi:N-glycosidase YbiA
MITKFEGRYSFLSNFYPSVIEHQGIKYPTVEHYYVAMKVNNEQLINGMYYTVGDFREMIAKVETPGLVKKIGRKVKLRNNWDSYKFEVMNWAVREKFKDVNLAQMLIDTGEQELIEGNWWHDNLFGSCICNKCSNNGKNHLGKILMQVRNELRGIKKTGLEEILQ